MNAVPQPVAGKPRPRRWFPRTLPTYILCAANVVFYATDLAGLPPGYLAPFLSLFVALPVLGNLVWQLIRVPGYWPQHRWGALLPAGLCIASLIVAGVLGIALCNARLVYDKARYEAIAEGVRAGTYSGDPSTPVEDGKDTVWLRLRPEDRALGYWAEGIKESGRVVAVRFMVVSHGFAHHWGFIRVYEGGIRERWQKSSARAIAPGWYRIVY